MNAEKKAPSRILLVSYPKIVFLCQRGGDPLGVTFLMTYLKNRSPWTSRGD